MPHVIIKQNFSFCLQPNLKRNQPALGVTLRRFGGYNIISQRIWTQHYLNYIQDYKMKKHMVHAKSMSLA